MSVEELMALAVAEAQKSSEPLTCGCVIARNGEIVAMAHNSQRADNNATAHAEIKAIAEAGRVLGNKNLVGCEAFCSCEPCSMCLSALIYAKVEKVYYATALSEVSDTHIRVSSQELVDKAPRKIEVVKFQ